MYMIYKDNEVIAKVSKPVFIKKHPTNNCYIPVRESDAMGISLPKDLGIYALATKKLDDLEQVVVRYVDDCEIITKLEKAVEKIEAQLKQIMEGQ